MNADLRYYIEKGDGQNLFNLEAKYRGVVVHVLYRDCKISRGRQRWTSSICDADFQCIARSAVGNIIYKESVHSRFYVNSVMRL
mgnify:CR=1 FL=1